ncbi:MAG: hypothetical protein J7K75_02095 [Desulfuromonas sp.]|nr:hypothetical protein [Desulfuromonas sp.]
MKKKTIYLLLLSIFLFCGLLAGCSTIAPTQFYRPANYSGEPYRISGKLEPMKGWNGNVTITINDQIVIDKELPVFSNTTEAYGTYGGKNVSATITKVQTFTSAYHRVEVFVGAEKAATLTF